MNICVCIKQVHALSNVKINPNNGTLMLPILEEFVNKIDYDYIMYYEGG